jgi:hypothetical protein
VNLSLLPLSPPQRGEGGRRPGEGPLIRRFAAPSPRAAGRRATFLVSLLLAFPLFAATEKRLDAPRSTTTVARELTVTLDVKDAEVRDILRSMQKQCGIRNLVVDPNVQGKGTFYFEKVPCRVAFAMVFRSLGIDAATHPNSVITAGGKQR